MHWLLQLCIAIMFPLGKVAVLCTEHIIVSKKVAMIKKMFPDASLEDVIKAARALSSNDYKRN